MTMAGPTPHEWLVGVLRRVKYDKETDELTVKGDDWRNMVSAARKAYDITETDDDVEPYYPS
jgi:hypothetical protein